VFRSYLDMWFVQENVFRLMLRFHILTAASMKMSRLGNIAV